MEEKENYVTFKYDDKTLIGVFHHRPTAIINVLCLVDVYKNGKDRVVRATVRKPVGIGRGDYWYLITEYHGLNKADYLKIKRLIDERKSKA